MDIQNAPAELIHRAVVSSPLSLTKWHSIDVNTPPFSSTKTKEHCLNAKTSYLLKFSQIACNMMLSLVEEPTRTR